MSTIIDADLTSAHRRIKQNLSPPESFDVSKPDDVNDWLERLDQHFELFNEKSDNIKIGVLCSLLDTSSLKRVLQQLLPGKLKAGSYADLVSAVRQAFGPNPSLIADRLTTFALRPADGATQDDWYSAVIDQTQKFDFERFSYNDFRVLVYLTGVADDRLRTVLLSKLRDRSMTLSEAHSLCMQELGDQRERPIPIAQTIDRSALRSTLGDLSAAVDRTVSVNRSAPASALVSNEKQSKLKKSSSTTEPMTRTDICCDFMLAVLGIVCFFVLSFFVLFVFISVIQHAH